ncbi:MULTISPECIES: helix-turn-helix domain-containing protein [Lentzea]|uniref:DNA binding domain-containing protein, excisionase family n=2 Tax=Lentzea TaxID=165301 RepID=A0A1W2ENI6_9PSEU|nr:MULTISPECIES: helix-turn-helix domain-containing protein [Lentzea]SFR19992.1 DNA binding domain-containing protein, excisionase family [Lentzea waywayandensis]SMD11283.1 DNA binding domain-containing protein, excisionase family [Lentzea albidocapillata]
MADKTPPAYLPVSEAAAHLSVSEVTIRRAIRAGKLPHIRLGRLVRVAVDDLDAFAAAHRVAGVTRDPQ